jgi:hypothetical protein
VNLPWLGLQVMWSHAAWGMVLAACGVGLLSRKRPFPVALAVGWLVLAFVLCAVPGPLSPAYWLGLSFQAPSALLVAGCAMTIWVNALGSTGYRVLPTGVAAIMVVVGVVLYADSVGWLHLSLYAQGYGREAALAGLLLGALAVLAVALGRQRGVALALLLSLTLFAVFRLPSGNLWDALLDPLLWAWALSSLVARWRASRRDEMA